VSAEVRISRVLRAPRELVFGAFTDPDQIAVWWAPEGCEVPRESVDIVPGVGGRIHFSIVDSSSGASSPVRFEIEEFAEPELLVFTSEPQPEFGLPNRMLTRIEFAVHNEGTRVTVTQGPHTDEMRDRADAGWSEALDKLKRLVESGEGGDRATVRM
jgi:uncharacterized protein YndB with AHSA1/START domain